MRVLSFLVNWGDARSDYSPESHPASGHFWFDGGSKRQQRTPGPAQYQGGFTPLIIPRPTCRWIARTQARKFARQNRMHVCIRFSVHCGGVAAASRCPPLQGSVRNLDPVVCAEKRESSATIQKAKEVILVGTHWVLIRKRARL